MAKKVIPVKAQPKSRPKAVRFQLPDLNSKGYLFLSKFWQQALVVAALSVVFYANSWSNHYALDDDIVMRQNTFVQKGFSGIGEILGNDAYKSFYASMGVKQQLEGGRYRPLSIVTFAIEQQLFGETYGARFEEVRDSLFQLQQRGISDIGSQSRLIGEKNVLELQIKETNMDIADVRHIFQIFWYALSMIILLSFLRNHIFRWNTDIAFLTVILFAIHPIHTEVVANVKSRDEIFSLMFIVLTLDFFFRYDLSRKRNDMLLGCLFFILAFLSKEYAAVLVALIPAGLMIFHRRKLPELRYLAVPVVGVLIIYGMIRLGIREPDDRTPEQKIADKIAQEKNQDPLNDPYMYCKGLQEPLTKINRLDDYVWLLLVPFPLVADYSYQHFPYDNANDPMVYLSLLIMGALVYLTWKLWLKRHPMSFALLFFFGFFMLINNMLFDIGATMGERLIYHSSLGFCMALAWGLVWASEKYISRGDVMTLGQEGGYEFTPLSRKLMIAGFVVLIGVPAFMLTQQRNREWDTDETLFISDVEKHPNSALCNGNAGARWMDRGLKYIGDTTKQDSVNYYADIAIKYLARAVEIHPRYANGWLNLGLCYYNKKDYAQAAIAWERVYQVFPSNPILQSYAQMLIQMANNRAANKDFAGASVFYKYGLQAYPADPKIWLDYAGSSFMAKNFKLAQEAFDQAFQHTPDPVATQNLTEEQRRNYKAMRDNVSQGYRAAHHIDSLLTLWQSDSLNYTHNVMLSLDLIGTPDFYPWVRRNLTHALVAKPGDSLATKLLDSLRVLELKIIPPPVKDSLAKPATLPTPGNDTSAVAQKDVKDVIRIEEDDDMNERVLLPIFLGLALLGFIFFLQRRKDSSAFE